jgi:chromosome segregation ATPase
MDGVGPFMEITASQSFDIRSSEESISEGLIHHRIVAEKLRERIIATKVEVENLKEQEHELSKRVDRAQIVIRTLSEKNNEAKKEYEILQKEYAKNSGSLNLLKKENEAIKTEWIEESARFNHVAKALEQLREERPKIDTIVRNAAQVNKDLATRAFEQAEEQECLVRLLNKAIDDSKTIKQSIMLTSASSQTDIDIPFIHEIQNLRAGVRTQLNEVKKARQSLDLIRRCS